MTRTRLHGPDSRLDDVARHIRNEFMEMPGMHLTFEQVRRLWHLPHDDCEAVLERLVAEHILAQDTQRRFCLSLHRAALTRSWTSVRHRDRSA